MGGLRKGKCACVCVNEREERERKRVRGRKTHTGGSVYMNSILIFHTRRPVDNIKFEKIKTIGT